MIVINSETIFRGLIIGSFCLCIGALLFIDTPTTITEYLGMGVFFLGWVSVTLMLYIYACPPAFLGGKVKTDQYTYFSTLYTICCYNCSKCDVCVLC